MDNALKGILLAAAVVITCVVIGIAFYYAREAKNQSASASENLAGMSQQFDDPEKQVYEGATSSGTEVIDCINKFENDNTVAIRVYHKSTASMTASVVANGTDGVYIYGPNTTTSPIKIKDTVTGTTAATAAAVTIAASKNQYNTNLPSTNAEYIRPNGSFRGSVQRDDDNNITMITFQQTK